MRSAQWPLDPARWASMMTSPPLTQGIGRMLSGVRRERNIYKRAEKLEGEAETCIAGAVMTKQEAPGDLNNRNVCSQNLGDWKARNQVWFGTTVLFPCVHTQSALSMSNYFFLCKDTSHTGVGLNWLPCDLIASFCRPLFP